MEVVTERTKGRRDERAWSEDEKEQKSETKRLVRPLPPYVETRGQDAAHTDCLQTAAPTTPWRSLPSRPDTLTPPLTRQEPQCHADTFMLPLCSR